MLGSLRNSIEGLLRSMVLNEYVSWDYGNEADCFFFGLANEKESCVCTIVVITIPSEPKKKNLRGEIANLSIFSFLSESERARRGFSLYRL